MGMYTYTCVYIYIYLYIAIYIYIYTLVYICIWKILVDLPLSLVVTIRGWAPNLMIQSHAFDLKTVYLCYVTINPKGNGAQSHASFSTHHRFQQLPEKYIAVPPNSSNLPRYGL